MINPQTYHREKILFAYTSALDQGDFARLETILEEARSDAILERQIMEINRTLSQPAKASDLQPSLWQRFKSTAASLLNRPVFSRGPLLRTAAAVLVIGLVVVIFVQGLLGPAMGNIFQNIVLSAPSSGYQHTLPGYPATVGETYGYSFAATLAPTKAASGQTPSRGLGYPAPAGSPPIEHLIVRSGRLILVAEDTRQARQAVMALIGELSSEGAFVVSSNETYLGVQPLPLIRMVMRVPVRRYDESMNRLAGMGSLVVDRQESAQDVTQDYVDVSARIEALQASRARLLEIIQEAKTTDDLLRAEQELSRRETELEAAQASQQYLEKTAALSSITLELRPAATSQPVTDSAWSPAAAFHNAVRALLSSLRDLADQSIYFTVAILPYVLVVGLILYAALMWARRRTKK